MTRKRFVKLAMSQGMPRNKANRFKIFVPLYYSYEELLKHLEFCYEFTQHGRKYKNCYISVMEWFL